MDRLNLLYRGPLSSCNYDCHYCPFAKRSESQEELHHDRECLDRFVTWLETRTLRPHGVFFTPWGEALTRRWYREAMIRLSHWNQIERVVVQTNLSCGIEWIPKANLDKVALWCTFHPTEVQVDRFVDKCHALKTMGVKLSVGVVGIPQHADVIQELRRTLSNDIYLWINAYKSSGISMTQELVDMFESIDPLFPVNNRYHPSLGKVCRTGHTTVSIDGRGDVRRCHFIPQVLGNIYEHELESLLRPRVCTNVSCGCHIGYVHLEPVGLDRVFGDNVLERIPQDYETIRHTY